MPDFLNTDGQVHVKGPALIDSDDFETRMGLDTPHQCNRVGKAPEVAPAPAEAATGFGYEDDAAPPSPVHIPRRSDGIQRGVFIWALVPVVVLLVVWFASKVAG